MVDFLQPIPNEYLNNYPAIRILLHIDNSFATPDLYKQCAGNGTIYVIQLKIATKIVRLARYITFKLYRSYPYKNDFYETLLNVSRLQVQLK